MKCKKNLQLKSKDELLVLVDSYAKQIQESKSQIEYLMQELALAKNRHYGRKSEKDNDGAVQLSLNLFDEAEEPDNLDEIEKADEEITIATHTRKKTGRKPLPKNLPRVQKIFDLPENEKTCICGCELEKIGEDKTEQLDIIPAKIQIIENIKIKYACKTCNETIKTSPAPKQPIPKSIASPGLLAHVLVSKFKDHLPLYRQENIFKRMNIDIARNTLSLWVIRCGEAMVPLYKLLQDNIINYQIAYADETRVQVLKEPGREPTKTSYMWTFIGGPPDKKSIIYKYDPGRAHTVVEETLEDFSGHLHCDGFSGYDAYAKDRDVKLVGCWAHARRKFIEITKIIKTPGIAHKAVSYIAKLYKLERDIKNKNLSAEKIYQYRQEHAKPVLDKLKKYLESKYDKVLPKSPIGKAIYYSLNQWRKLERYIDDGRLEIDNNLSERTIKPFVIGRKNWMFSTSVPGVKAAEVIYSIIETCCAHKIEVYSYLRYVLAQLPNISTEAELQLLLPFNIDKNLIA